MQGVTWIELSGNQLSGGLPEEWGLMPKLERLILSDNKVID